MKYSRNLLITAEKDLESVLLLYNSDLFSNSVFLLQQAIEKIVKSFGLEAGIINENELKNKISHLPHKVIIKMLDGQILSCDKYKGYITSFMIPEHEKVEQQREKEDLILLKKVLLSNQDENKNNIHYSIDDYELLLSQAEDLEKEKIFNDTEISANIKFRLQKIEDHFRLIFANDSDKIAIMDSYSKKNRDLKLEKGIHKYKEDWLIQRKFDYITFVWSNLSIMTAPHEQVSRYPANNNSQTLEDIYNRDLPIVRYTPEIVNLIKKTIVTYKELYNIIT